MPLETDPPERLKDIYTDTLKRGIRSQGGCLLWPGAKNSKGYGQVKRSRLPTLYLHRLTWAVLKGSIPAGFQVCHTCDVRHCFEEKHLFLGTPKQNTADMMAKGRNVPIPPQRGLNNVNGKLSDAQVVAVYFDHRSGNEIAAELGVDKSQISAIRLGQKHRHLTSGLKRLFCERI